jgi:hypothetical protein
LLPKTNSIPSTIHIVKEDPVYRRRFTKTKQTSLFYFALSLHYLSPVKKLFSFHALGNPEFSCIFA